MWKGEGRKGQPNELAISSEKKRIRDIRDASGLSRDIRDGRIIFCTGPR